MALSGEYSAAAEEVETRPRRSSTTKTPKLFKGVRMRKWGRWVSEIRVPRTRSRIWLGSYDTPEKAARAYDAALYCLRGPRGPFNFPADGRPDFSDSQRLALSKLEIKTIAARFSLDCMSPSSVDSSPSTGRRPMLLVTSGEGAVVACDMISSVMGDGSSSSSGREEDEFLPDSFLLGEAEMLEVATSMWDLL